MRRFAYFSINKFVGIQLQIFPEFFVMGKIILLYRERRMKTKNFEISRAYASQLSCSAGHWAGLNNHIFCILIGKADKFFLIYLSIQAVT